ncbi:MAG: TrkA C-terminal domain-containing protein, partial [Flavobacteriaceae bacterium]
LDFPKTATIGGVIRNGAGIIALGDFIIQQDDLVLVCCLPQSIRRVEQLFL